MSWLLFFAECNHTHRTVPDQVDSDRRPEHFHRFRSKALTPPDTHGRFWRLTFPKPADGSGTLGFRCQLGLGLFCLSDGKRETE